MKFYFKYSNIFIEVTGMYKEKIVITSNDVDKFLNLKVSSFFKYFQQVSTKHSEIIKVGTADTIDKGMSWVIIRMEVRIYDYPKMNEEVLVTTHPGEVKMFLFPRYYEMYDKKGKLLASSSAMWVVLDSKTRRVLNKPFGDRKFPSETCKDDIPLPEKIKIGEVTKYEDRVVRYSDIDLNGHLNNTKYIDFMLDTKEAGFYDDKLITKIVVNYDKELREGEKVSLYVNDNVVQGKNEYVSYFAAYIEYKNR